ncbi:hemolysin secretion/activation protein [Photorhabdus sp. CRCIA-P01]|uniref:hemolysin secretion/activation protein n=1 Tax=Photorhabdus sp. CRCIA-P01 TaxID=2019570 RepID=UPI001E4261EF|nr:hemolysin secretion/activation protein [Photorhabdus sp. CRCIA-P01]
MKSSILVFAIFYSVISGSQAADLSEQQRIHQQARQPALEAQLAPPAEVHLSVPETRRFPNLPGHGRIQPVLAVLIQIAKLPVGSVVWSKNHEQAVISYYL